MAGLSQWWLAHILGWGRIARVWSGCLVVGAGHLCGKLEMGTTSLLLSTAACSLVIPPFIGILIHQRRRYVVLFAMTVALAIVSGQGYLQIGTALTLPIIALSFSTKRALWEKILIGGVLGVALAGFFVVPFAHFYPQLGKDIDKTFASSQPLAYLPLNLIISDTKFYLTTELSKQPYGYLYMMFIGWIPVGLAITTVRFFPSEKKRIFIALLIGIAVFWCWASALFLRPLVQISPEFVSGIRNPAVIASLSVPLVIALAAWGVDLLWQHPSKFILTTDSPSFSFQGKWVQIILLPFLLSSLFSTYKFSQLWLITQMQDQKLVATLEKVNSSNSEWVAIPFGEHFWAPIAAEMGIKLTNQVRPSSWRNRPAPAPHWEMRHTPFDSAELLNAGIYGLEHAEQSYASVIDENGKITPCKAHASGGHIDVECSATKEGKLVVQENSWSGWQVSIDGDNAKLEKDRWLKTSAPAGTHTYQFRYRPIDVYFGLFLSICGIVASVWYLKGHSVKRVQQKESIAV